VGAYAWIGGCKLQCFFFVGSEISQNFDLKNYDFDLYKEFSIGKKWPEFARF
jgi:hypothetical protein